MLRLLSGSNVICLQLPYSLVSSSWKKDNQGWKVVLISSFEWVVESIKQFLLRIQILWTFTNIFEWLREYQSDKTIQLYVAFFNNIYPPWQGKCIFIIFWLFVIHVQNFAQGWNVEFVNNLALMWRTFR